MLNNMTQEEIKQIMHDYIKEHLTVTVSCEERYVCVSLNLDGEEISYDSDSVYF